MFLYSLCITVMTYVYSLAFNSYTVVTGAIFAIHFIIGLAFDIGYILHLTILFIFPLIESTQYCDLQSIQSPRN